MTTTRERAIAGEAMTAPDFRALANSYLLVRSHETHPLVDRGVDDLTDRFRALYEAGREAGVREAADLLTCARESIDGDGCYMDGTTVRSRLLDAIRRFELLLPAEPQGHDRPLVRGGETDTQAEEALRSQASSVPGRTTDGSTSRSLSSATTSRSLRDRSAREEREEAMSDAKPLTPDEERSLREDGLIQSPCTMERVWATIDAERAARSMAEAKLEPTKWGHVKAAINEMRTDESAIEDATAKRIAEAMHSDRCPIIGGTADIQRVGEWMIRGDWRKPDAGSR